MKFFCPVHGEVTPKKINYSLPATGPCPVCLRGLEDQDASGVQQMSDEEAEKLRPDFREGERP